MKHRVQVLQPMRKTSEQQGQHRDAVGWSSAASALPSPLLESKAKGGEAFKAQLTL